METLAQSVCTIALTTTPVATIPLVCARAGNGTWPGHNSRSPRAERRLLHHSAAGARRLGGAIPSDDSYETNFTTGQRNIFRQACQRRMDVSFVNNTSVTERMNLKFSFDVFNITNAPGVDVPI